MKAKQWPGSLSRSQAISLIDKATDHDDPYWENLVDDHYDERTDTMPTVYHVLAALGVSESEYRKATGADGPIDWPR